MKCTYFPSFRFWSRPPSTLVIPTTCVCYSSQLQRLIGFQKPQPNSNCASLISRHKLKAVCSQPCPHPSHFLAQLLVSHCCGLDRGSRDCTCLTTSQNTNGVKAVGLRQAWNKTFNRPFSQTSWREKVKLQEVHFQKL